jgi:hypothetical protein
VRAFNNFSTIIFMKKVRIFLSAVAVVSIVTGAFAFRAQKNLGTLYCKTTASGTCSTTKAYATNGETTYFCGISPTACASQTVSAKAYTFVGE